MQPHSVCVYLCYAACIVYICRSDVILIEGGTVVNHDRRFRADVLIKEGKIHSVGLKLGTKEELSEARRINAEGRFVMPGGIDPHTHLDMPFMGQFTCDDFFSGQAAALAGGTTMHIDFALPVNGSLTRGLKEWVAKSEGKAVMDYGFHMAVTSWSDDVAREMEEVARQGVNSFKFFLAYKGALMVDDEQFIQGLSRCKELGALAQVHAENGEAVVWGQQQQVARGTLGPHGHALSRPAVVEGEATGRAIRLAALINTPLYVVHVMSKDALQEVVAARLAGQRVIGEPVASGLALNESCMWDSNFTVAAGCVMSPPIRSEEHRLALKKALSQGLLQLVGTDHAVFNSSQKAVGRHDFRLIPNGVNGLEERMHVVWEEMVNSGLMTPQDFVRVTSTAAAQIFNIYPQKGVIAEGSDADVIILDPNQHHIISAATHHSRLDTNVYEGKRIKGKVVVTISNGQVVWENDELRVVPGRGRLLALPTFGPLFEGLEELDRASWRSSSSSNEGVCSARQQLS